jgi:hypothetical protein
MAIVILCFCIGCQRGGSNLLDYKILGVREDGGAQVNIIEIDTDNLDNVPIAELEKVVQNLIKSGNAQEMFDKITAYYFYDKGQNVSVENADTDDAKAYYWYLTRLLIKDTERVEIKWK